VFALRRVILLILTVLAAVVGMAFVAPADAATCALAEVTLPASHLYSGDTVTGTVRLSCAAAEKTQVELAVGDPAALTVPASVTVRRGQTSARFPVTAAPVNERRQTGVTATLAGIGATAAVTVDAGMKGFSGETWQVGGRSVGVTINLTGWAPPEGTDVALASSSPLITVPPSYNVAGLGAVFSVPSQVVTQDTKVTLTATLGQTRRSFTVTLAPTPFDPGSWELTGPAALVGGTTTDYTVSITNPAPVGGLKVGLSDENHVRQVHLPSEARIPAGQTRVTFPVSVDEVVPSSAFTVPSIKADIFDAGQRIMQPYLLPALLGVTGVPDTVRGGTSFDVTLTYRSAWEDLGLSARVTTDSDALRFPVDSYGNVTGEPGASTVTFTVTADPVTADTPEHLTIDYPGKLITLPVTITP
jgi:hypothetical protein